MPDVTLYVGPSAFGIPPARLKLGGIALRPPVRRGDIDELVRYAKKPGVVVVCDGVFQTEPAVSHAELCRAIDVGWQVWGVSSIGAIRAYELRDVGMHGFGYVRSMFDRWPDFLDDEMCLLHFPEKPYFPVSEALVNLRFAFDSMANELGIDADQADRVLEALRKLWFGDRTVERIRATLLGPGRVLPKSADALLDWLQRNRIKTLDLVHLVETRPWSS